MGCTFKAEMMLPRPFYEDIVSSKTPTRNFKEFLTSKGGFFSESAMCFSSLQISPKKYSKKLS
jgi:hypothetical protein